MKCVVALAIALTAQAIDIDWKIPVSPPTETVEIKDGVGETAGFKEVDILTCQGYVHVIDKVLFYDDADGSDGASATTIGLAAGAVALGAALL